MRNLTSIAHVQADLSLPSEIGLVRFAAQDEENNVIYIGGSGLTIACINATSFEVRFFNTNNLRFRFSPLVCK